MVSRKSTHWRTRHSQNRDTGRQRRRGAELDSAETSTLSRYHQMISKRVPPHINVYTSAMKIYARRKDFEGVENVFRKFQETGLDMDVMLLNTYIFAHRITKDLESALEIVDTMEEEYNTKPTILTYSELMVVSSLAGNRAKTEELYNTLLEMGPDFRSYNSYIQAMANLTSPETIQDDLENCRTLLKNLERRCGKAPDRNTYGFMVALCSKAGLLEEAFEYMDASLSKVGSTSYFMYECVFGYLASKKMSREELNERMVSLVKRLMEEGLYLSGKAVQNIIDVFDRRNRPNDAYKVFRTLRERDMINEVAVLEAIVFCIELLTRKDAKAFEDCTGEISKTVKDFKGTGIIMTSAGFKSWIDTCVMVSDFKGAQECWRMDRKREPKLSGETANTLIEFSLKRGTLRTAMDVLDFLLEREVTPTLKQLLMFVEYMEESGDTTKVGWLATKMNAANFEPSEKLRERMADLTAAQKEAMESA